jgi:hypothetical protein
LCDNTGENNKVYKEVYKKGWEEGFLRGPKIIPWRESLQGVCASANKGGPA